MSTGKSTLTAERLRELLHYDPETGIFTNRVTRTWKARAGSVAGSYDNKGYVVLRIDSAIYKAHRLAWLYVHGVWPSMDIDHKNQQKADNRIANLRDASKSANRQNVTFARRDNKLGVLGVYQRGRRFVAHIQVNGVVNYLGTYATVERAQAVFWEAKKKMHIAA